MSNLMDALMAELERVNNLETEVKRTVEMHNAQIKASRDIKMERPRAFLTQMGWNLAKLGSNHGRYGYFPDIPLDVYHNGKQLYVNFSIEQKTGDRKWLSVYGGYRGCIEYRVSKSDIHPDYEVDRDVVNALIDQWDDECEQKLEQRIAKIIKESMAEKMEAAQKKLNESNNEFEQYFKGGK